MNSIFTIDTGRVLPSSEAVQKISTGTLLEGRELYQLTKTANFKATPMKKHSLLAQTKGEKKTFFGRVQ